MSENPVELFVDATGMSAAMARLLVEEGYETVEELAYVPVSELKAIEGLDFDAYMVYRQRARDFLLRSAP